SGGRQPRRADGPRRAVCRAVPDPGEGVPVSALPGLVMRGRRQLDVLALRDPVTALAERADRDLEPIVAHHPGGQLPGAVRVSSRLDGPGGKVQGPGVPHSLVRVVPRSDVALYAIGGRVSGSA